MIELSKNEEEEFLSKSIRIFDLEYIPEIAYGIDSSCFFMKLSLNFKDYMEEGPFRLFLLKKEDLAEAGASYNKRKEDLNQLVEVHVPVSVDI